MSDAWKKIVDVRFPKAYRDEIIALINTTREEAKAEERERIIDQLRSI